MAIKNIQDFWRGVRKQASLFDPEAAARDQQEFAASLRVHLDRSQKEVWLIAVPAEDVASAAGTVASVISTIPIVGARWMAEGTHVIATPAQVAERKSQLAQAKEQSEKEEADRKGVPTSKLLEALVAAQSQGRRGREAA